MSTSNYNQVFTGMEAIRQSWGWFLFLGIALIILGVVSIVFDVTLTLSTAVIFGWFLLIGGIVDFPIRTGTWSGFFLYLLSSLLRAVTGCLLLAYPRMGAESLTLLLSSYFIVGGLFRSIGSGRAKLPRWGWAAFSGIVSVILGITVLRQMPMSAIWFVGIAVGLEFIVDGIAVWIFASAIHQLRQEAAFQSA